MSFSPDPRLDEAKLIPLEQVARDLDITWLRSHSGELVGPCPVCGGHEKRDSDRFSINPRKGVFNCRKCDVKGYDPIALVMQVQSCDFKDALGFLCGDARPELSADELKRREEKRRRIEAQRAREAEKYRNFSKKEAIEIWKKSRPGSLGIVGTYLKARGIDACALGGVPSSLRFIVDHPYVKKIAGKKICLHRGPAMIAGIRAPSGRVEAVHQTWIDLNPPHGKAKISHDGENMPAKLVRGSKKGNAIRLIGPDHAETLIMGEGIETTLSAAIAAPIPNAAYWAGVDLGNMSGRMQRVPGTQHSGIPDLSDERAFLPPPWVKELIFIMDGDSAPKMTRAKLESGLKRAMHHLPGLKCKIVPVEEGKDLNDLLAGVA